MPDASSVLLQRLQAAFDTVAPGADPVLRVSDRADFQANGALALAKQVGRRPQEVAEQVVAAADLDDICSVVEVSGPGFINLTLRDDFVARQVAELSADPRLGVAPVRPTPRRWSSTTRRPTWPRRCTSGTCARTIIGDALARVLGFLGHDVRRENHIGDWGTPFGMLIEHLVDVGGSDDAESFSVRDLNEFYTAARRQFDGDPSFAERSRRRVVLLQSGDPETMRLWRIFVAESMRHAEEVYDLLGVLLTAGRRGGGELLQPPAAGGGRGARRQGASRRGPRCAVRLPRGVRRTAGRPPPAHRAQVRRRLRLPRHRPGLRPRPHRAPVGATRLVYVVGAEQALHLRLVFAVAALAGYLPDASAAVHVGFGLVLGTDGKKLASRSGGSDRLVDLLAEADRPGRCRPEGALQRPLAPSASRRSPTPWASGRSSTPTCRPSASATTCSTGTACSPSRAIPAPTCSTPTPASAPSSGGARWRRRAPGTPPLLDEPQERALATAAAALRRGGRGDGRDLQPLQVVHLPLRPGHRVHHVLRGVPRPGGGRGRADLPARPCAT